MEMGDEMELKLQGVLAQVGAGLAVLSEEEKPPVLWLEGQCA